MEQGCCLLVYPGGAREAWKRTTDKPYEILWGGSEGQWTVDNLGRQIQYFWIKGGFESGLNMFNKQCLNILQEFYTLDYPKINGDIEDFKRFCAVPHPQNWWFSDGSEVRIMLASSAWRWDTVTPSYQWPQLELKMWCDQSWMCPFGRFSRLEGILAGRMERGIWTGVAKMSCHRGILNITFKILKKYLFEIMSPIDPNSWLMCYWIFTNHCQPLLNLAALVF